MAKTPGSRAGRTWSGPGGPHAALPVFLPPVPRIILGVGEGECCLAFLIFHDPKLSHGTLSSRCYAGKHSDGFSRRYDTMPQ